MSKRRHLIILAVWAALLAMVALVFWGRLLPDGEDTPSREGNADAAAPAGVARIVGRWVRTDGGYVLDIKAVHDDGKIDATYLNPRPIHVSKARAITKGGHVVVVVTLQDRGYPGSMYTLTYDAEADRFEGVYHHRGLRQQFDVKFTRFKKPKVKGSVP